MGLKTPLIAIIGVFAGAAVFLVCDAILLILFLVYRRRRRHTDPETGSSKYLLYPHYKRIPSQQLQTSVPPGRYMAPLTVRLEECPLTSSCGASKGGVDILVDIQRGPLLPALTSASASSSANVAPGGAKNDPAEGGGSPTSPPLAPPPLPRPMGGGPGGEVELLGWDAFFHDHFALHHSGTCLHFNDAGTYKVQAYTACEKSKKVSMVHQWVFVVESPLSQSGPALGPGGGGGKGSAAPRHASRGRSAPHRTTTSPRRNGEEEGSGMESETSGGHHGRRGKERRRRTHRKAGASSTSTTLSTSASFSRSDSCTTSTNASPFSPSGSDMGQRYRSGHRHHRHGHTTSHSISPSALPKRKPLRSSTPQWSGGLPAPRIVPTGGPITTATAVHLHPTTPPGESGEGVELRYSTDGSYPSLLYTGPFSLRAALPPPLPPWAGGEAPPSGGSAGRPMADEAAAAWRAGETKMVLVKAVALRKRTRPRSTSRDGKREEWVQSEVTQAMFHVTHAATAFLDPSLPSPSLRVRALDAKLYFDLDSVSRAWEWKRRQLPFLGAGQAGGVYIFYQCHAIDLASRPDGPPPLTAGKAQLYAGVSVALPSHLTRVFAWTVVEGVGHSAPSVYEPGMEVFLEPYEEEGGSNERQDKGRDPREAGGFPPFITTASSSSAAKPPPSGPFLLPPCPENRGRTGISLPPNPSFPLQPPPLPAPSLFPLSPPPGAAAASTSSSSSSPVSLPTLLPPQARALSPSPALLLASAPFLRPEIPSPVMCVSCKEMEFSFADPPAHTHVAYTLNRTEPTLTDVFPPASAALSSAVWEPSFSPPYTTTAAGSVGMPWRGAREAEAERRNRCGGRNGVAPDGAAPSIGAMWPSDMDGLHTFLYESGRWIRVSLLEAEGLHVTARICKPVWSSGSSTSLCRGHGCTFNGDPSLYGYRSTTPPPEADTVLTTPVGTLLGYRLSAPFHRGFYYLEK